MTLNDIIKLMISNLTDFIITITLFLNGTVIDIKMTGS